MANTGEKTWITEICPAVTDLTEILNSLPHDPLLTATQLSLGYAFFDMAVSVLPLLTDATNLNKIQMHRPMNTMSLHCFYVFVQIGI